MRGPTLATRSASFARFTLGLMQHGAPTDLLAAGAPAMADEVDHARGSVKKVVSA